MGQIQCNEIVLDKDDVDHRLFTTNRTAQIPCSVCESVQGTDRLYYSEKDSETQVTLVKAIICENCASFSELNTVVSPDDVFVTEYVRNYILRNRIDRKKVRDLVESKTRTLRSLDPKALDKLENARTKPPSISPLLMELLDNDYDLDVAVQITSDITDASMREIFGFD